MIQTLRRTWVFKNPHDTESDVKIKLVGHIRLGAGGF